MTLRNHNSYNCYLFCIVLLSSFLGNACKSSVQEDKYIAAVAIDPVQDGLLWEAYGDGKINALEGSTGKIIHNFQLVIPSDEYVTDVFVTGKYIVLKSPAFRIYNKNDGSLIADTNGISTTIFGSDLSGAIEISIGQEDSGIYNFRYLQARDANGKVQYYDLQKDRIVEENTFKDWLAAQHQQHNNIQTQHIFDGAAIAIPDEKPKAKDGVRYFNTRVLYSDDSATIFQARTDALPASKSYIISLGKSGIEHWNLSNQELSPKDYRLSPADIGRTAIWPDGITLYLKNEYVCKGGGKDSNRAFFAIYRLNTNNGKLLWAVDTYDSAAKNKGCEGLIQKLE